MADPITKGAASGLADAIAEAVSQTEYPVDDTLESQLASFDAELAEDDGVDVADATPSDQPSRAEPPAEETSDASEGQPATEAPDSYWGVDLTGIPVEKRADIIAHFEQQDGTIRKLQAKLAEPLEVPAAAEAAEVEEVTDEQLLAVMGVDPEDFSIPDALKQVIVRQARNQLQLEDQVAQLTSVESARSFESQWNTELDNLESTYGKLPGTREEVLRFALREEVVSPADLYFKLTAPVKREVESLASKARREAAKREQSGGLKPRSSSAEPAPVQPGMTMRDAVKAAAQAAQKETGLSWKTAVKRVLTAKPEGSE